MNDVVVTVEVEAESEDEALSKASDKAATMSLNEAGVVDENSCITDVEDL